MKRRHGLPLALLVATAAILAAVVAAPAWGATLTVNTTADHDDGTCDATDCTLREAVVHSSPGDTIDVPAGTYTLSLGQLDVTKDLTITGAGARSTTVSGGGSSRVFQVESGVTLNLSGVTVTGGSADVGGGVKVFGTLNLSDSAVTGNSATVSGGGIDTNGTVNVSGSTIADNHATGPGFAIGGGIDCFCTVVTVVNSTIANNTASGGSGNSGGGILYSSGNAMTLTNVTLAGNSAGSTGAGGIDVQGTVKPLNTVIANNSPSNCNASLTSQGYNLSSDSSCGLTATGDIQNANPLLGPLQDNGGQTDTMLPQSGSPLIDAGTNSGCPATDQRGLPRPAGSACDIGAVEVQPASTTQTNNQNQQSTNQTQSTTTTTQTSTASSPAPAAKPARAPKLLVLGARTSGGGVCGGSAARIRIRVGGGTRGIRVRVLLDGKRIMRTTRDRFTVAIHWQALRPGVHRLRVVATNSAGRHAAKTIHLVRCRSRVVKPRFTG